MMDRTGRRNRPIRPPGKLRALIRELGPATAAAYGLHRLLLAASGGRCALHCYRVVVQPVADRDRLAPRWRRGLAVRQLAAGEAAGAALDAPPAVLAGRLTQGHVCFAVFAGTEPAGYHWLSFGPFEETEVRCRFTPDPAAAMAWDYDLFIAPRFRGGPVFAVLWDASNAALRAAGRCWTSSRISAYNRRSLEAHRRLGARVTGTLLFLRAGPWQLMIGTLAPYLHLSLSSRQVPQVTVRPPPAPAGTGAG